MTKTRRVWYAAWEMQCCGDPFEVGSHIEWRTTQPDSDWLDSLFEPADADRFTDAVDHHPDANTPLIAMSGVVRAIDAVSCYYELLDGAGVMTPVPRSGVLRSVSSVDGWEREDDGSTLVAYAVDVELEAPELS